MTTIRCEECGIGHYQPQRAPYLLPLGSHMMVIPDAPSYSCDVCGFRSFDEEFLDTLHSLLSEAAAAPERPQRRPQRPQPDPLPLSPPARSRG
jgi:YgiT-type zinc finger domain-containing protein